jgi:hypothetical protein
MSDQNGSDIELPPLSEEDYWVTSALVEAGYRPGRKEIGGHLARVAEHWDDNKFLVPGPFERGQRYVVLTTTDGRNYVLRGRISGSEILRYGKPLEFNGLSVHAIDRRRLKPAPRKYRGRSCPQRSHEEILKEKYILETIAVLGFSRFMGRPFSPDRVPLGHAEWPASQ